MVMRPNEYVQYPIPGPFMNQSVPPNQVQPGSFGELVGVDGRFNGCLRKFYGMAEVVDIADDVTGMGDLDTYDGPSYFKYVTFRKRGTSTIYHGFVIRWDKIDDNTDEEVTLVYTADNGSNWSAQQIWATGSSIASTDEMDCAVDDAFLLVAVDGQATKCIYWLSAALTVVTAGAGDYAATLAALTDDDTAAVDSSYNLRGNGTFQVRWRFYDSARGIYSGMSDPVTITLNLMKTTKATGTVSFNSAGGDSGLMVEGDILTINSRTYEYISGGSDVTISAAGAATVAAHAIALADAINGDSSADVTARAESAAVLLEAKTRGSTANAYDLSISETGANTDDIDVSNSTLTGGGLETSEAEEHCKAVLSFPVDDAVISGTSTHAGFAALFDTVDVFRTIDLGDSSTVQGAIFYLEQTIAEDPSWDTEGEWDALNVTIGTLVDDALPFQTQYDPEKDIVKAPPQSGTIGRYQGLTFMAETQSPSTGTQYDIIHSSAEHESAEYFTTYNRAEGSPNEGRALRILTAGDSAFALSYNAIKHIYKSSKDRPLQFSTLHQGRGLTSKGGVHVAGNSIFMVSSIGLVVVNANDGNMGQISAVDRVLFGTWAADLATIESAYDSVLNCSFFLNPTDMEMVLLWHSTHATNMLEGANFVGASEGPNYSDGKNIRAYFITKEGLVVMPDATQSDNGNMWDLSSSYTLDGTITTASAGGTAIVDSSATFHADMIGALCYITYGDNNEGAASEITAVDVGNKTLTVSFGSAIAIGDRYSICPVPFKVRLWPLADPDDRRKDEKFRRWNMSALALKVRNISGFSSNDNDSFRCGVYRNNASTIESNTTVIDVNTNPADSAGALSLDGIDLEPYVEQIACGVSFELTRAGVSVIMTDSRNVTA